MKQLVQQKFSSVKKWMCDVFSVKYHSEIERYLALSTDTCDLEHRIRQLRDRGFAL